MTMSSVRRVDIRVGAHAIGHARTWAYPDGDPAEHFRIPTYKVTVSGTLAKGTRDSRNFEALRFGVQKKGAGGPQVVGLADQQRHVIKAWLPHYRVHSARSTEQGAWQVYGNFLIHDGPDSPLTQVYASIGCIEICNGPRGFDKFNDTILQFADPPGSTRDQKLAALGRSGRLVISYDPAIRPPLKKWTP